MPFRLARYVNGQYTLNTQAAGAERIVAAGVEDHDLQPRARALHLPQHDIDIDHLEIDIGLAHRIGADRHQIIGAADLHAVARIIEQRHVGAVALPAERLHHRVEPAFVEIELRAAADLGVPVVHRGVALGAISEMRRTVAVAGNHDHAVLPALAEQWADPAFRFTLLGRGGSWEETVVSDHAGPALRLVGWSFAAEQQRHDPLLLFKGISSTTLPILGIVHGDLKPANVMYEPESDAVKVADFGIARITDSSKTKTGMVLGTPSYMSPEQLSGKKVDGKSDLFSLSVSLYQLLCGQLPFTGDSMAQLMYKIANEQAPNILEINPNIPPALVAFLDKAMAKDAEQRYANGEEFAKALRATMTGAGGAAAASSDVDISL